jgi:hypothetical protein
MNIIILDAVHRFDVFSWNTMFRQVVETDSS